MTKLQNRTEIHLRFLIENRVCIRPISKYTAYRPAAQDMQRQGLTLPERPYHVRQPSVKVSGKKT